MSSLSQWSHILTGLRIVLLHGTVYFKALFIVQKRSQSSMNAVRSNNSAYQGLKLPNGTPFEWTYVSPFTGKSNKVVK